MSVRFPAQDAGSVEGRHMSSSPLPAVDRSRIAETFIQVKTTFDKGESSSTPALVVVLGYALTIPVFLLMLALAELAYHFG